MISIQEVLAVLDGMAGGRVQQERIAFLHDQYEAIVKELVKSQEENARLKEEAGDLCRQIEENSVPKNFIEHRGVLFQRRPNGQVEDTVYCPRCKTPMANFMAAMPFTCGSCPARSGFNGGRLHEILREMG